MTAIETDIPTITPLHREALRIRHAAVQPLLKQIKSPEEGIDLLLAVVWPSDPLLGLDSSTPSATESS